MDQEKRKSIMEWCTPYNVTKVRSFMGLIGYYCLFIYNFSKIVHPIMILQTKGIKFQWTPKCEANFEQLKYFLKHAPIFRIVDPKKDFMVCTNACKEGISGVLMQEG